MLVARDQPDGLANARMLLFRAEQVNPWIDNGGPTRSRPTIYVYSRDFQQFLDSNILAVVTQAASVSCLSFAI